MYPANIPFTLVNWSEVTPNEHKGETGHAMRRDYDIDELHVHMAEYSPGYKAAGWCSTGHVLSVLKGQLITELKDGRVFTLNAGMSYIVSDDEINPHRSHTDTGATLLVVDL